MSLELIYGCMFSGKTSKLIERYNELKDKYNCLAINYIFDKRYTNENKIVSHDKNEIDCICIQDINELRENIDYSNKLDKAEFIFINEAQFFKDLRGWVLWAVIMLEKNVILCGLDLDYKRESFGDIMKLVINAYNVHHMKGKCDRCANESLFTHRLVDNDSQVLIGSCEYIPVCENCWNLLNNKN